MQLIALGFFILAAGVASSVQAIVNAEVGQRTDEDGDLDDRI